MSAMNFVAKIMLVHQKSQSTVLESGNSKQIYLFNYKNIEQGANFQMVKVTLVTTKTCVYCPTAKKIWNELKQKNNFDYEEVDATSPQGQQIVQRFGIMSVPTTIINNKMILLILFK